MSVVDSILETVSLLDHVPVDAELRKVGQDAYRGKCVLHGGDSRISFSVRRHRNGHLTFECFVCHERGSVIDFVARHENIPGREAIRKLMGKNWQAPDPVDTLRRHAERHREQAYGAWGVLACVVPGCLSPPRLVASELDAALLRADSSAWEVAPDGIAAICPQCVINANNSRAYPMR